MPGAPASPLPACRCGHSAEGGLGHTLDDPQREVGSPRADAVGRTMPCRADCPSPWVLQVQTDERVVRTERGILLRSVQRADAGLYLCHATEHGFTQPLLRLSLEVIGARQAAGMAPAADPQLPAGAPGRKVWYRDFLQLVERPPLGSADKVCQRLWSQGRPPPPPRAHAGPPGRGPTYTSMSGRGSRPT
uniref:Uncharacterized protein n=1 Tax=Athene cunicularia TaxID=194338 RepID=A0A663MFP3_ATHCN